MSEITTFIEKCLNGDVLCDDIDDYIDIWHESDSEDELFEFLGMTREEYALWVKDPDALPQIIANHQPIKI